MENKTWYESGQDAKEELINVLSDLKKKKIYISMGTKAILLKLHKLGADSVQRLPVKCLKSQTMSSVQKVRQGI